MKFKINTLIIVGAFVFAGAATAHHMSEKSIRERTQPVGKLVVAAATTQAGASAGAVRSGEEVYKAFCTTCHATGVANAPKTGTADWKPRLAKGIDGLVASSVKGLNAMPPKGTCMNCSDAEIKAAIQYMTKGLK